MKISPKKGGLVAVAAVLSLVGLSKSVLADDVVSYYTTGTFDTTSANFQQFTTSSPSGTNLASVYGTDDSGETVTLSFDGVGSNANPFQVNMFGPGTFSSGPGGWVGWHSLLGDLKITTSGGAVDGSATATGIVFDLNIFQEVPVGAGGGTLVGTVRFEGVTVTAGSASVSFTGANATIITGGAPPITYTLDPQKYSVNTPLTGGTGTKNIYADLTAQGPGGSPPPVPLPAVASMGMSMLGLVACGLAGRKLTRRVKIG